MVLDSPLGAPGHRRLCRLPLIQPNEEDFKEVHFLANFHMKDAKHDLRLNAFNV